MKKAFVPICLYSNGFFLVKDNLRFFLHVFSDLSEVLFVIVDKLYGNNLLIKDKVGTVDEAKVAYNERGKDIMLYVKKTIQEYILCHCSRTMYKVVRWEELSDSEEYIRLKSCVEKVFENSPNLKTYSQAFINHCLAKMTKDCNEYKQGLEYEYLFGEITMSIYLTEYLGYENEIWEKPQSDDLPDPIDYLYKYESASLQKILNERNSIRVQHYLAPVLNEYITRFEKEW